MAYTIENTYTGNGSTVLYSFTFPYLETTDIKVTLDQVANTAWTLASATQIQFNSAPGNNVAIRIYRDTDISALQSEFFSGSAIRSQDLNNDFNQTLYVSQETEKAVEGKWNTTTDTIDSTEAFADVNTKIMTAAAIDDRINANIAAQPLANGKIFAGNGSGVAAAVTPSGDLTMANTGAFTIATGAVEHAMLANDAVDGDNIADNAVNSEHYAADSIDTEHYAPNSVDTTALAVDAVTGDQIADNSINSEHYADGSIDHEHFGHGIVDSDILADNSVNSQHYVDGSIDHEHLSADCVTGDEIADNAINSEHYADGSIDRVHLGADIVDGTKIADNSIDSEHYVDGSIDHVHLAADAVDGDNIADSSINSEHYADGSIDHEHFGHGIVDGDILANDSVDSQHYVDGSIDAAHIANNAVSTAAIGSAQVTLAKVENVSSGQVIVGNGSDRPTAVAMSGDVAIAAGGATTIQANAVEIGMIGCEQTTISDSDLHIPTSGAVVDYVAAQIAPIGGLEVIADEDNFPTTQPAAGVVISIADAGGVVFNGSGVSTTARTAGNGSDNVTINGAPSSLYSETLAAGVGMQVSSTGSSHTYNYHKILSSETDVKQLSDDINDFNSRYRIASSAPGSNNDEGDLYFDTGTNKMYVYDGSAWGEVTSTGDYKFLTVKDHDQASGGSGPTFNGSNEEFDLFDGSSDASITSAAQLLVVLNGVLQKPNSGTFSGSEEGYYLNDTHGIKFCDPPASGSTLFVTQIGSATTLQVPADGSVTAAKIAAGAVSTAKLAADAVDGTKLADNACDSEHYTDGSIDHVHLAADAVDGDNIADDSINSEHYVDGSIDHAHLSNDCIDGDNIQDDVINSEHIAAGAVDLEHMASESVDEDNLKISNAGSNGQFLQKQSGNTGGLTWATATAQDTLSFRNLVVNGAMNIAQRGTSSSGGSYKTVDRIQIDASGAEEYPTQSQQSTSSSDTGPWAKGFKKFYRITNGNQTGGAGAGEHILCRYKFEAQDIANSAWECANTNSYLTVSFWVRASVAQTYYVNVKTEDGTAMQYSFAYTPSANTWLKVEHSIPGHADLQFDSNNALGLTITFYTFNGTNNTHSGASNNSWRTYDAGTLTLDQTSTWFTTNDATWDLTGLQVEAGDTATEFEHRSFADELERCQRYYYHIPAPVAPGSEASFGNGYHFGLGFCNSSSNSRVHIPYPVTMRTNPASVEWSGTQGDYVVGHGGSETQCNGNLSFSSSQAHNSRVNFPCSGLTTGQAVQGMAYNGSAFLGFEAEL